MTDQLRFGWTRITRSNSCWTEEQKSEVGGETEEQKIFAFLTEEQKDKRAGETEEQKNRIYKLHSYTFGTEEQKDKRANPKYGL